MATGKIGSFIFCSRITSVLSPNILELNTQTFVFILLFETVRRINCSDKTYRSPISLSVCDISCPSAKILLMRSSSVNQNKFQINNHLV